MNWLSSLERASLFGLTALVVALLAQWILSSRIPASWRAWIWRVAMLQTVLVLVPLVPLQLAILPPRARVETVSAVQPPTSFPIEKSFSPPFPSPAPSVFSSVPSSTFVDPPSSSPPVSPSLPSERHRGWNWHMTLFAVYLLGVGGQCLVCLRNALRVRRILQACVAVEEDVLNVRLRELAARLDLRRLPKLLQNDRTPPFLVGVFRPCIVIPRVSRELGDTNLQLEAILTHELAHLKRRDLAWSMLLWGAETLFWFHPLSWATKRFHTLEVESACDEMVLRTTRIPAKSYGELLLNTLDFRSFPLTAGVGDGFFALKTRLHRLHGSSRTPRKLALVAFAAVLALTFCALVPFRLVARAQNEDSSEAPRPITTRIISGTLRDLKGKPVAGAKVYLLNAESRNYETLSQVASDASGKFRFSVRRPGDWFNGYVFADAGLRGMNGGRATLYDDQKPQTVNLRVAPTVRMKVRLVDPQSRPVPDLKVRLRSLWQGKDSHVILPNPVWDSMKATTNAQGEAIFPPLSTGMLARFQLGDKKMSGNQMSPYRQFAPLAAEDYVRLESPMTTHVIQLTAPVRLSGQLRVGVGKGPASNIPVNVRRITAAEARGEKGIATEPRILQTRTDAGGRYSLAGLRPGTYSLNFGIGNRVSDEVVKPIQAILRAPSNRIDVVSTPDAIIQGVVVSQDTKQPVQGQLLYLIDPYKSVQTAKSDSRGHFQFRTVPGTQRLATQWSGDNSPPAGFVLPRRHSYDFTLKGGEKRTFKFELLGTAVNKPIAGTVVDPAGEPVAGATVLYRRAGNFYPWEKNLESVKCDSSGRFTIASKSSGKPLQLFADANGLTTARSTIALTGEVKLQLQQNAWASIQGHVVDENKQAVAGASVQLLTTYGGSSVPTQTTQSDQNGDFSFERMRPGTGAVVEVTKDRFSKSSKSVQSFEAGRTVSLNCSILRASKTLSGLVLRADGTPVSNAQIFAPGQKTSVRTGSNGKFFVSQVFEGPLQVQVYLSPGTELWKPFSVRGGDRNLVLRLNQKQRLSRSRSAVSSTGYSLERQFAVLGQTAPEIRAVKWGNNRATSLASLRGKVVLLVFDAFNLRRNPEIADFAQSQKGKVEVVGVQDNIPFWRGDNKIDVDVASKGMGIPVALDEPFGSPTTTTKLYGGARYMVIGRSGKVLYADGYLERAFTLAMTTTQ